jgi:hypothetical protein
MDGNFENNYTKKELLNSWVLLLKSYGKQAFESLFNITNVAFSRADLQLLDRITYLNKSEIIRLLVLGFKDDDFIRFVINAFPKDLLMDFVWSSESRSLTEVENEYEILISKGHSWSKELIGIYAIFRISNVGYNRAVIYLPEFVAERFKSILPKPNYYYWEPVKDPAINASFYYNNEKGIFTNLPRFHQLFERNLVKFGARGNILDSYIKKLKSGYKIEEFFPEHFSTRDPHLAARMQLEVVGQMIKYAGQRKKSVLEELKQIILLIEQDVLQIWPFINSHYRNTKNVTIHANPGQAYLMDVIKSAAHCEGWISVQNYISWIFYHNKVVHPFPANDFYWSKIGLNGKGEWSSNQIVRIDSENYAHLVLKPYYLGFIYFLASLGIVELIALPKEMKWDHEYDTLVFSIPYVSLEYFRFTDLGRHVLGLTDTYSVPDTDFEAVKIQLGKQFLTIHLSREDVDLSASLTQFASKVNDLFFALDKDAFLKGVDNFKDFQNKKKKFESIVIQALPNHFEKFFKEIESIFNPFESDTTRYRVFFVPENNKELIHYLMSDQVLKNNYVKAEGRRILIPEKNYRSFVKRMKELGWVI